MTLIRTILFLIIAAAFRLSAGEAEPVIPQVSFKLVSVGLTQDFRPVDAAADAHTRQYLNAVSNIGCVIGGEAVVDDGWILLKAVPTVISKAQLDSGESLPSMDMAEGMRRVQTMQYRPDPFHNNQRFLQAGQGSFMLRFEPPKKPATTLKSVHGKVEITFVEVKSLKHIDVALKPGVTEAVEGVEGCDVKIGQAADGKVILDYSRETQELVHKVAYLDADGKPCTQRGGSSRGDGRRNTFEYDFDRPVVTVAIDFYTTRRSASVGFEFKEVPLVGTPSDEVLAAKPARSFKELKPQAPPKAKIPPAAIPATPGANDF